MALLFLKMVPKSFLCWLLSLADIVKYKQCIFLFFFPQNVCNSAASDG